MKKRRFRWKPKGLLGYYLLAFGVGLMVGFKLLPIPLVALLYFAVAFVCFYKCIQGDVAGFFTFVPFGVYTEVYVRAEAEKIVPYLSIQYLFIFCFSVLIFHQVKRKSRHSVAYIFLALFTFLELANTLDPDNTAIVRTTLINSFALLMPVIWASFYVLKPILINTLLNNIKIAAIYLAGIVFVAHLSGKIDYGLYSSSASSNGMAPVQLSGYLGVGCSLFFLSIMNPEDVKNRWVNVGVLTLTAIVMVLTFSRGGLYFLGSVIGLYLFYNRTKLGQYAKFLILIPLAFVVYYFVVSSTGGVIVERYGQEGTSSRDVLVKAGFEIFFKYPIFGVGTGNYNSTIVKENLFSLQSGAHNEFVRAAAEHGIVGIVLYWGFFIALLLTILRRKQPQKQYAMYFFALFCLIIIHNGLKISIQPLLLMLAVGTPTLMYRNQQHVQSKEFGERSAA